MFLASKSPQFLTSRRSTVRPSLASAAMVPLPSVFSTRTERGPPPARLIGTLNVAPEAVVIPTLVPPLIHPVSGRPSPSTSMTCLVTAPAGTPVPAGAHPEDSAVAGVLAVPALVAPEAVVDAVPGRRAL